MNDQIWKIILSSAADVIKRASLYPDGYKRFQKKSVWALRAFLPYYLHEADERNFIWVNRDYKPLGIVTEEWIDYMQFPWLHVQADEPVASLGRFCLFEGREPWESRACANWLIRMIESILRPDLDLHDTNDLTFKLLVGSDMNWKRRFAQSSQAVDKTVSE